MQGEIKVKSDKLADFNQKLNVQKTINKTHQNEKERLSLERKKESS
jgi:hypothetical protein